MTCTQSKPNITQENELGNYQTLARLNETTSDADLLLSELHSNLPGSAHASSTEVTGSFDDQQPSLQPLVVCEVQPTVFIGSSAEFINSDKNHFGDIVDNPSGISLKSGTTATNTKFLTARSLVSETETSVQNRHPEPILVSEGLASLLVDKPHVASVPTQQSPPRKLPWTIGTEMEKTPEENAAPVEAIGDGLDTGKIYTLH